jgi:hypothetical protein
MKSLSKELLGRSISAMVGAIEIYNKPGFPYRTESFSILAINAWELLFKAKWLADRHNRIHTLWVKEYRQNTKGIKSKKKYIKRTQAGNPVTLGIDYLAKKLVEDKKLNHLAGENIQALLEIRNSATHFFNKSPPFRVRLQEVGSACTKNFAVTAREWFNREISEFELYLMPLTFMDLPTNMDGFLLNAEEKNFLKFLDNLENEQDDPNSPYSVTVNIEIKFIRSKAKDALTTQITNDPSATPIRLTEEQIRERYPWDYDVLTGKCKERYQDFKANQKYHDIRKPLQSDQRFGAIRFLDPGNPKSAKKPFFNPNILTEMDKHYIKKAEA